MYKKIKALSVLLPVALVGCGTAGTDDPDNDAVPDTSGPSYSLTIGNTDIANVSTVDVGVRSLSVTFNEAVDSASLVDAVTISPALQSTTGWELSNDGKTLTYTLADDFSLDYNQSYNLTVNGTIRDLAGNTLLGGGDSYTLKTQTAYQVGTSVEGLQTGSSMQVQLSVVGSGALPETKTISSTDSSMLFDTLVPTGYRYSISLSDPVNADNTVTGQLCTGGVSGVRMGNQDVSVPLTCSQVYPRYLNAAGWNEYVSGTPDTAAPDAAACPGGGSACFHGGEYRVYAAQVASCDGVVVTDALDAFNWVCDDSNGVQVYSSGLKQGKGLTDLIDFTTTPAWTNNSVILKDAEGNEIERSQPGPWWSNTVSGDLTSGFTKGNIYALTANPDEPRSYFGATSAANVAIVVKPTLALQGKLELGTTEDKKHFLWLEGDIDATGFDVGLKVTNMAYSRIQDVRVRNAGGPGVVLSQGEYNRIDRLQVVSAASDGLVVTNYNDSMLTNIVVANSGGHGMQLGGKSNTLSGLNSYNNIGHGLLLQDAQNNSVLLSTVSSNGGDGLHIASTDANTLPKTAFNYIAALTSANNEGHGVIVQADPYISGQTFNGVLAAMNAGSAMQLNDKNTSPASPVYRASQVLRSAGFANSGGCTLDGVDCGDGMPETASVDGVFAAQPDATLTAYTAMTADQWLTASWASEAIDIATSTQGGVCNSGENCQQVSWSMLQDGQPGTQAGTAATHHFYEGTSVESKDLTSDQREVLGDYTGNDDGLCETGEACVAMPNAGSDQSQPQTTP